MADAALTPWWLGIGVSMATSAGAVIGKLWTENRAIRAELAAANDRVVTLQLEASKRSDEHQSAHRRDLRRLAGLSTSMDPPPPNPFAVYPTIIEARRPERTAKPGKPPRPRPKRPPEEGEGR